MRDQKRMMQMKPGFRNTYRYHLLPENMEVRNRRSVAKSNKKNRCWTLSTHPYRMHIVLSLSAHFLTVDVSTLNHDERKVATERWDTRREWCGRNL